MSSISDFFAENGYYHARGVFAPEAVAELEAAFDGVIDQLRSSGESINARWESAARDLDARDTEVWHTHQVHRISAAWMRACLHEPLLDVAEAILGPDIVLHHSKLFCKPAGIGAPFPMHQDWNYFPSERDSMIAGIIHVSEASEQMGCLRVYPGSHRLGRVRGTSRSESEEEDASFFDRYPLDTAVAIEADPGDVVFFHYFTLHGSLPNRSERARKTVLLQLHDGDDFPEVRRHPYAGIALRGQFRRLTRSLAEQEVLS